MPKVWYSSYTSEVRVFWSDTHTSDKYSPYCSDHILPSGFGVSGKPDIPKLSAGQGLSSFPTSRSTHPRHSSREVFVITRKRHHGKVGIAGLLCHHILIPYGFTSERAFLSFSVSYFWSAHRILFISSISTSPWFLDFGGAKLVKGADDKIPMFYFACLLPAGFPFSLITRRKPGIPEERTKLFGHELLIFHF